MSEQKTPKPKIEDIAVGHFKNEKEKSENILDFIKFLRDNKLSPRPEPSGRYKVHYKNKYICYINFFVRWANDASPAWSVDFNREFVHNYDKYITDDELKKFIVSIITPPGCEGGERHNCGGRYHKFSLFGENYDRLCTCWPFQVKNPACDTMEIMKKLILESKLVIEKMTNKT